LESAMFGSGEQPSLVGITALKGDFNLDGVVNSTDLSALLGALTNISGYESLHGITDPYFLQLGDLNGDGAVNNADIQPMLHFLIGGSFDASLAMAVPEPTTLLLV